MNETRAEIIKVGRREGVRGKVGNLYGDQSLKSFELILSVST